MAIDKVLKGLRDLVEFGPIFGEEATRLVMEADVLLAEQRLSKDIYLCQVVHPADSTSISPAGRHRRWGFYYDLEIAKEKMLTNYTDMSELGYYRYGLISRISEGVMALPEEDWWFEFIWEGHDLKEVREIPCPEIFECYCFGL